MNPALSRLSALLLAIGLLCSPILIAPLLFPSKPPLLEAPPITPITFSRSPRPLPQTKKPVQSKLASLLEKDYSQILGVKSTPSLTPKKAEITGSFTIALLGDSMIDVMQPGLPQLESALKKFYPNAQFELLNYGVGASNIELAQKRLTSPYTYLGWEFPPLLARNPDIVVLESFAYNHWENNQGDLDRQWLAIGSIVDAIKKQSRAKIVLAAAIAPNQAILGDGILDLLPEQKIQKAATIKAYLQNIVNFATSQNYPLADAFHASLDENGNGKIKFINTYDHLHPSGEGGELLAEKIAEAIFENDLL